uniref:Odorant binding protein 17 n=1 Tax=Dendroctonus ponderosae TaxID=77166 RepID=A0A0H3W575_DENPD|nr:odorant binding protein 17 [Dendroctonus ponderosae]
MQVTMNQGWFLLLVSVVSVFAELDQTSLPPEAKELMAALHKNCIEQVGVSEADVDKLRAANFEEDANLKCYTRCLMAESGVMDENGAIDIEAFGEILPEAIRGNIQAIFRSCSLTKNDIVDQCVKAYEMVKCWHKENPESYFMI